METHPLNVANLTNRARLKVSSKMSISNFYITHRCFAMTLKILLSRTLDRKHAHMQAKNTHDNQLILPLSRRHHLHKKVVTFQQELLCPRKFSTGMIFLKKFFSCEQEL